MGARLRPGSLRGNEVVAAKLIQRTFEVEGQKRTTVEIQVQHVGPDLQFQSVEVRKATSAEEKQTA